jgi:threonine dehydratase
MAEAGNARARQYYHGKFWKTEGRLARFLAAAVTLRAALGLSPDDLEMLMEQRAGPEFTASGKSVGRWLSGQSIRSHAPITNLCIVLREACADRRDGLEEGDIKVAAEFVAALAERIEQDANLAMTIPARQSADGQYYPEQLRSLLRAIPLPPEDDHPDRPEFPPHSPRFPATPCLPLQHNAGHLIIKDESWNPTGNHKDRWAWEKLLQYRGELEQHLEAHGDRKNAMTVPRLSMISGGSAAYALQTLLRLYGLPPLRVLMDRRRTDSVIVRKLQAIGALITLDDLDTQLISEEEVRTRTNNSDGKDITTRSIDAAQREKFYDWLVCEILLAEPTHIFVPFGTGELFTNIILFLEEQATAHTIDQRLADVDPNRLTGIHVFGATAATANTLMKKLYAAYRPTTDELIVKLAELKARGVLGQQSAIVPIEDRIARKGLKLAEQNKINTELSGIAGLGLFLDMHEKNELALGEADRILVVNTGWLRVP